MVANTWLMLQRLMVCAVLALAATGASAQVLAKPTGPVILTITGKIAVRNSDKGAEFDAAMLDAMAVTHVKTSSPWHKTPMTFSGPSLKAVLDLVGANGNELRMAALDKYEIKVPFDNAALYSPVLARRLDGKVMTVRQKGPLFMMFPFDARPDLRNDTFYTRCIWQLRTIHVG